ncbi:DUF6541 family protein [Microbacterium rhizosphaerae]|uniref:DUF6541 family protein n=1 Tax=Microbacterium rhizosphaerae TaxID=1678237 RepID=A0ABZ0SSL9_9MICO|nr:DUF6541 family protein [Microbacterium rhizosphaerae]WPR91145.1 DUF6541 family protein [Microbacterium rhizosphaerae]
MAALIVIGLPGALIAVALRLRGLWLAAATPLLGFTAIAVASVWSAATGVRWAWWTVLATALVIAGVAFAFMLTIRDTRKSPLVGWRWAPVVAIGSGASLIGYRLIIAIGEPDRFDQAGDNVFHLNAVRWVLDHGDASPLHVMRGLDPLSVVSFYPTTWHATVALACQLSGVAIPVASNALLLLVACLVWPTGAILLARTLFGAATVLVVAAGAICSGFAVYPLILLPYMGTYPLFLSVAMLPASIAALAGCLGLARVSVPSLVALALSILFLPGIVGAHPSAVVMLIVMALPMVYGALWAQRSARRITSSRAILVAILCPAIAFAVILLARTGFAQSTTWKSSTAQAIGEAVLGGFAGQPIPLVLSVLTIVGIIAAIRLSGLSGWVATGIWALTCAVYIAASSNYDFVRLLFTEPWYADAMRIAAFTPVAVIPLAARGAEWLWVWSCRHVDFSTHPARFRIAEVAAALILSCTMVQSWAAQNATRFMQSMFTPTDNQYVSPVGVSADDRTLLARIPSLVPANAVIAGDPWTGASFAFALTGRQVLVPHMLAPITGQTKVFLDGISTSSANGPACRAAKKLGVDWVLELHGGKTLPSRPQYPGLKQLENSPNMELIDRVGDSSLYKIVGCSLG